MSGYSKELREKTTSYFLEKGVNLELKKKLKKEGQGIIEGISRVIKPNALLLPSLNQFQIESVNKIIKWFDDAIIILDSTTDELIDTTGHLLQNNDIKKMVFDILRKSELGFKSIEDRILSESLRLNLNSEFYSMLHADEIRKHEILTKHSVYDETKSIKDEVFFNLRNEESLGSQKFFGLLGPIAKALIEGKFILVDEIDSRFHTNLLNLILNLFHSNSYNIKGSQLLYTTHNSSLMGNKNRRDQILHVEKDKYGASKILNLHKDKSTVRHDLAIEKNYGQGHFI